MLKSNFIKPKLSIEFFGKTRFWVGLFLGLGYAFLLYCFFSFLQVSFHYFFYLDGAGFAITTPIETQFYQFFFAFSGFLFGQNAFFEFTLSRSKSFKKNRSREFTILHHSRMVTWFTLFVGFSVVTTFKILGYDSVFLLFNFFQTGWWISIFVLTWLHFYMWMKVAKYFRNIYPLSIVVFFMFGLLSFGLSYYDPVPYPETYRYKAKSLTQYKLKIKVPSNSITHTRLIHKTLINTIFLGDPERDGIPDYGLNDAFGTIDDIPLFIENFKIKVPRSRRGLIIHSLAIDKDIKMKNVYELFNTLSQNHSLKISLAALPEGYYNPDLYHEYFPQGLLFTLHPTCDQIEKAAAYLKRNPDLTIDFLKQIQEENFLCYPAFTWQEDLLGNEKTIKISATNEFFFNEKKINRKVLFEKIKQTIWEEKENVIFIFDVDDEATYEHYFFLRHEFKRAFNEARNQASLIRFGTPYKFLEKSQQKEIRANYPMIGIEFLSPGEKYIFNFFNHKKR